MRANPGVQTGSAVCRHLPGWTDGPIVDDALLQQQSEGVPAEPPQLPATDDHARHVAAHGEDWSSSFLSSPRRLPCGPPPLALHAATVVLIAGCAVQTYLQRMENFARFWMFHAADFVVIRPRLQAIL